MKATEVIYSFVLEKAQDVPVSKRIELYRAVASVCGHSHCARSLIDIAEQLEYIEANCRQLALDFARAQTPRPKERRS